MYTITLSTDSMISKWPLYTDFTYKNSDVRDAF